jgi:hypothetical protein
MGSWRLEPATIRSVGPSVGCVLDNALPSHRRPARASSANVVSFIPRCHGRLSQVLTWGRLAARSPRPPQNLPQPCSRGLSHHVALQPYSAFTCSSVPILQPCCSGHGSGRRTRTMTKMTARLAGRPQKNVPTTCARPHPLSTRVRQARI